MENDANTQGVGTAGATGSEGSTGKPAKLEQSNPTGGAPPPPAQGKENSDSELRKEAANYPSYQPPQRPPQREERPPADHPLLLAIKALLDHLGGEPKHARLDSLWQKCRAEYDKVTGGPAPSGRIAGDEHPGFRNGADTDASLAGDHNTGSSDSQSRFDF